LHAYDIVASTDAKAASEIRILVYAAGCEIRTFTIPLEDNSRIKKDFECHPIRQSVLSGLIVPSELITDKNAELIVEYQAFWAHEFFGIVDGAVVEIRVASVSPNADGTFQVDLPHFKQDDSPSPSAPTSSFHLLLRDAKTWNHIALGLEPEMPELKSEDHCLRIASDYPYGLRFLPWPAD